jgi:hypothetical protein
MNSSHFERVSDIEACYAERAKPRFLQITPAIKSDWALGSQGARYGCVQSMLRSCGALGLPAAPVVALRSSSMPW